ncbi:MAG: pirin family protein [Bacteroidota bacterium]
MNSTHNNRSVQSIIPPPPTHFVGDGFKVHHFIPDYYLSMERMNPFLMLDYNAPTYFPPSETPRGVDVHPHKGFETVTIAYQGKVAHHDSAGNSGVISEGGVQWMSAASGVLHKEYHEANWAKEGGIFQMVQLWVNLPSQDKKSPPKYQSIDHPQIPQVNLPNDGGHVEIIAGLFQGKKGAASTHTEVHLMNAHLKPGGEAEFTFSERNNTALLVIHGSIEVNGNQEAHANHFVLMNNDGETFHIRAKEQSIVLVLSGEPILEPIAAYGPFVMNTKAELIEAFQQFERGEFGNLE